MVIDYKSSFVENKALLALDLEDQQYDHQTFAFKRESEFVDIFNFEIKKMEESGVLQRIRNKWTKPFDVTTAETSENGKIQAIQLGFENVIFPFIIITTGICTGVLLLCSEKLFTRQRRQ